MNETECLRFLTARNKYGYYARQLAPSLDIATRGKFVTALAREIHEALNAEEPEVVDPIIPETIPPVDEIPEDTAPEVELPIPPTVDPKKPNACTGCGGVGDTPKFLRWAKVAQGRTVTVSVDDSGKPASLHWLTPEIIMEQWFKPWEVDTSIRFELVATGLGDIRIKYEPIDGPGKTLGFAWQPDQSVDFMESGGDLSGDIVIDSIDRWTTEDEVHAVGEHEVGHAIGLPHSDNAEDVLYPYSDGKRRPHSINDKKAKTLRYPPLAIAA